MTKRLAIVDLFCGIGGSALGIKRAHPNSRIRGYDIRDYSDNYPFDFHQTDLTNMAQIPEADFYWASPPCHKYSVTTEKQRRYEGKTYPDLISYTRRRLDETEKPFVIENVIGAPLIDEKTIIIRGQNFPDLRDFRRPRKFEIHGFQVPAPEKKYEKIFPYYRLISGGGGWIRNPEKVLRMTLEEANKRFGVKGDTLWDVAQIVLPQYAEYSTKFLEL